MPDLTYQEAAITWLGKHSPRTGLISASLAQYFGNPKVQGVIELNLTAKDCSLIAKSHAQYGYGEVAR